MRARRPVRIKNVMSRTEWRQVLKHGPHWFDDAAGGTPDACAYMIAMNNAALPDDDPRKITHAMVGAILKAAHHHAMIWGSGAEDAILRMAEALESYLPPEAT